MVSFRIVEYISYTHSGHSLVMFALFIFQWAFLLVETIWVCEVAFTAWISKPGALCSFGTAVPITQVLGGFSAANFFYDVGLRLLARKMDQLP